MKAVLLFIWLLIILVGGSIWSGYVLSVMWAWFVVPTFHLPQLSIAIAIGLSMVVRMLTYTPQEGEKKKSDTADTIISSFCWSFLYPLLVLGVSYCVHLFV
jgi:hypothetical protein